MAVKRMMQDHYEILRVPFDAGPEAIAKAYKTEILKYRDLRGGGEHTRRINLAYTALSDPERRRNYDAAAGRSPIGHFVGAGSAESGNTGPLREAEPLPAADVAQDEGDAPRKRWSAGRLALGALAAALVLMLALVTTGVFQTGEQVASRDRDALATAPTAANGALGLPQANERGMEASLAEVASTNNAVGSALPDREDVALSPAAGQRDLRTDPVSGGNAGVNVAARDATEVRDVPTPPLAAPAAERQEAPPALPAPELVAAVPARDRSSPAQRISGGLLDSDNRGGRFEGSVGLGLSIGANGRLENCRITRSSGNGALDATTCRLLQERLQFEPARDRAGNAIPSEVLSMQVWSRRPRR